MSELGINIQSRAPSLRTQWQVAIGESDLPATTRLVAWALSTWMNSEGFCWPQQSEIARRAGVTDRAVRQALRGLREADFLGWKTGKGPGHSNHYQALMRNVGSYFDRKAEREGRKAERGDTYADHARHGFGEEVIEVSTRKSEEPSANSPLRGSPTQAPTERSGDAPWKDYPGGWRAFLKAEDQKRCEEEKASEARVGEAI